MLDPTHSAVIDAEYVIARLEEAGATLLALPVAGVYPAGVQSNMPNYVRDAMEAYGWSGEAARPAIPGAAQITRMDEALSWVALIPADKMVLRRVVHARCLVHPVTDRHRYTWKQLARSLGADARAVQRWHEQAINLIVRGIINSAKRAA